MTADTAVNTLVQSAHVVVHCADLQCDEWYVKVRNTRSKIEELDFIHGAENHSHLSRRSDW